MLTENKTTTVTCSFADWIELSDGHYIPVAHIQHIKKQPQDTVVIVMTNGEKIKSKVPFKEVIWAIKGDRSERIWENTEDATNP